MAERTSACWVLASSSWAEELEVLEEVEELVLEEVLKEVTSHDDVWIATGSQVADYWRQAYPKKEA